MIKSEDINKLIANPSKIEPEYIQELEELVRVYPYFGTAHLLLAAVTRAHDHVKYQQVLKRAAIHVSMRSRLYHLIEFINLPKSEIALKTIKSETQDSGSPLNPVAQQTEPPKVNDLISSTTESIQGEISPQHDSLTTANEVVEIFEPEKNADQRQLDAVEVEMGRSLINAFIEKEVIQTVDHSPKTKSQPESFGDWLAFMKKNNGQPYSQIEEKVIEQKAKKAAQKVPSKDQILPKEDGRRKKNLEILDKIIATNPGPIRVREEKFFTPETKAKESLIENEHLVTETLARIYALQGNTTKAIRAYEILSLKYPQKSAYFATLILKLRQNE